VGQQKWTRARAIAALYRDGESLASIASRYGISRQRVATIMKTQTGIAMRPRGRPKGTAKEKTQPQN
jgi:lambda repressor-like predicted transcriptional regulator